VIEGCDAALLSPDEWVQANCNGYIAPEGCEVQVYEVERPYGSYRCNQLVTRTSMFGAGEHGLKVI